jgi:hypothetical protein
VTLPCPACQHPVDIEGLCRNVDCPEVEKDHTPVTVAGLAQVLTRMRDVMMAEREKPQDDAKTLQDAAEDLFARMKAYADSDPMRSAWVSAYVEGYAMKLGKLIHEHDGWGEEPKGIVDMSYARCGENSDVYVYATAEPIFVCSACVLSSSPFNFHATSRPQMIQHLNEHIARGHKVGTAVLRLEREIEAGEKP